tara:strand:- start:18457 stop:18972 length:516 start_codon:yes stop_codon:yes gene_type:complete
LVFKGLKTNYFLGLALILMPLMGISQHAETSEGSESHCYFKKNSFSLGIGLPYSLKLDVAGINARFYYNIGEAICFGPEFSYFNNGHEEVMDVDFVGHYIFETPWVGLFPLAGVNYTLEKSNHRTLNAVGVVFGAGLHRNFGKVSLFGEYAHVESKLPDDFITLGLFYNFK